MSREMASERLRCPANTVGVRLMRARERLRTRLTRRGLALPAGFLASGLRPGPASAAVSAALSDATIRAGMRCVVGKAAAVGATPASVVALAEGVIRTMILTRLKMAAVAGLAIGLVATGGGVIAHREAGAQYQSARTSVVQVLQDGREQPSNRRPEVDEELARSVSGRIIRAEPIRKDCMVLAYLPDWAHGDVDNIAVANNDGGVRTLIDWPAVTPEEPDSPGRQYFVALYSRKTTSHEPAGSDRCLPAPGGLAGADVMEDPADLRPGAGGDLQARARRGLEAVRHHAGDPRPSQVRAGRAWAGAPVPERGPLRPGGRLVRPRVRQSGGLGRMVSSSPDAPGRRALEVTCACASRPS